MDPGLRRDDVICNKGEINTSWITAACPTEQVRGLKAHEMRAADPPVRYLVGTPKGRLTRLEKHLIAKPWQEARPGAQSLPRRRPGSSCWRRRASSSRLRKNAV